MSLATPTPAVDWAADPDLLRCVACGGGLSASETECHCNNCGAAYLIEDGVLIIKDDPAEDNRVARDFYNSALWPKFRFWEWFFFICNGGEKRSRNVILRHLPLPKPRGLDDAAIDGQPDSAGLGSDKPAKFRLLDVAIGDGAYLQWLPDDWQITGIDVSRVQLASCRRRNPEKSMRLILGEAECLPFHERRFDAVLSIGGFNHFSDPEGALREMVRVARPGAPIVISDELPNLTDRLLGRKIGLKRLDHWVVSKMMNLGDEFTDLVERHKDIDIAAIGQRVLNDSRYRTIWLKGGYLMTGTAP